MTLRTTLPTVALTAGVAFIAGITVADPGTDTAPPPFRLANADLTLATSCDTLRDWYVERGLKQVTPWGWKGGIVFQEGDVSFSTGPLAATPTTAPGVREEQGSSETGTNVQEVGVDEADTAKSDGSVLVRIKDDDLVIYDVTGSEPKLTSTLALDDIGSAQLLLRGDTVTVIGSADATAYGYEIWRPSTRVLTVDIRDLGNPRVTDTATYDAGLLTARQHGDTIRITLTSPLPSLGFTTPGEGVSEKDALLKNREIVRNSQLTDWLPTIASDHGPEQQLVDCADVALPSEDAGLGTLTVVGFHAASPRTREVTAVATNSTTAYESGDRLILATHPWSGAALRTSAHHGTTHLYSFALDGIATTYVASGEVEGTIADRWAIDAVGDSLRVAVGPSSETGNFNAVVTMRERGSDLVQSGRVDQLGINEQIQSVRWFDDLAIMVTFRQTDPLYAIDLGDPDAPRLLGKLKIPGFSDYLHPIGDDLLLGLGQDADPRTGATLGAQAALFDISDLTALKRVATVSLGKNSTALAGSDPRAFTWLTGRDTALAVVSDDWRSSGDIAVLGVAGRELTKRMAEVDYGQDVYAIRTLPLPDGRVLLVTGDDVSFFEV